MVAIKCVFRMQNGISYSKERETKGRKEAK